jgi:signal transduction histidine kinase
MTNTNQQILIPQITHDLRNYIAGIFGLANIIADNINSYQANQIKMEFKLDYNLKEASEIANMLAPYANQAFHYLGDMLDVAQGKVEKFNLDKIEDCDLRELINLLLLFNKVFINDHQITIETNIEDNLPKLPCNIFRLKQLLTNLITNAVKYSKRDNKVRIILKHLKTELKNQIYIEIADHGIGMTEEEISMALNGNGQDIDKLDLDHQVDSDGLGLAIVKQLVDLMEGKMVIDSKKGKGTKVKLWFDILLPTPS